MNKKLLFVLILLISFVSCDSNNTTQQEDLKALLTLKESILNLVNNANCSENSQCKFIALGSKPCGGPWEYLVYQSSIDEENLMKQVAYYNLKEQEYNQKWTVVSDCMVVMPPTRVDCVNNKCVAVYNN